MRKVRNAFKKNTQAILKKVGKLAPVSSITDAIQHEIQNITQNLLLTLSVFLFFFFQIGHSFR